ncbi:MAG: KAP family NTPase [Verrucomicrobiales bacterium]|nr:KAP family NTPase [Verrucomicrobiales bacterium]
MVMALYGDWGSGKSSIKNMVLENLRKTEENCPIILEFNPWRLGSEDQLLITFFSEVSRKLEVVTKGAIDDGGKKKDNAEKRASLWKQYGRYVAYGASTAKAASTVMGMLGVPGSPLVDLLGKSLTSAGELGEIGKQAAEDDAESQGLSLEEIREKLRSSFKSDDWDKNFLIVIDDIDRLNPSEIRQIVRLVKANSDFPRFIFLLLCEKSRVEQALDEEFGGERGAEFLEKIVQLHFDVPAPSPDDMNALFFERINFLLDSLSEAVPIWDKERHDDRFAHLYNEYLKNQLRTPRAITRYLNVLELSLSSYLEESSYEANPVDVMALEAIRLFDGEIYSSLLAEGKATLLGITDAWNLKSEDENPAEKFWEATDAADAAKKVVRLLFPNFDKNFYNGGNPAEWRHHLRVCSKDCFDRYFEFDLRPDALRESEVENLLQVASDPDSAGEILDGMAEGRRLGRLLERLESSKEMHGLNIDGQSTLIAALWDRSEKFPERGGGILGVDGRRQLSWFTARSLRSLEGSESRDSLLLGAVKKISNLANTIYLVARVESDKEASSLVTAEAVSDAAAEAKTRLSAASHEKILDAAHEWPGLLHWWREKDSESAAAFIERAMQSAKGLEAILRSELGVVEGGGKTTEYLNLSGLEKTAPADEILETINSLGGAVSQRLSELRDCLEMMIQRRNEGKSLQGSDIAMEMD